MLALINLFLIICNLHRCCCNVNTNSLRDTKCESLTYECCSKEYIVFLMNDTQDVIDKVLVYINHGYVDTIL